MTEFPPFMPNTGGRVPADPADFLRDLFLANKGRIRADLVDNAIARHGFTYGHAIAGAWRDLIDQGYVERDGADWVWPMQVHATEQ